MSKCLVCNRPTKQPIKCERCLRLFCESHIRHTRICYDVNKRKESIKAVFIDEQDKKEREMKANLAVESFINRISQKNQELIDEREHMKKQIQELSNNPNPQPLRDDNIQKMDEIDIKRRIKKNKKKITHIIKEKEKSDYIDKLAQPKKRNMKNKRKT